MGSPATLCQRSAGRRREGWTPARACHPRVAPGCSSQPGSRSAQARPGSGPGDQVAAAKPGRRNAGPARARRGRHWPARRHRRCLRGEGRNPIVVVLGGPSKYYAALVNPEDSSTWKALGEFIRAQRQLADLSLRQLAELAKVSNPYLSQVERGLYKPSAQVLKGIAEALQVSAESMYMRAGLLDEEVEAPSSVEMAIRTDLQLTTEQKETLLRVYRGLLDHS